MTNVQCINCRKSVSNMYVRYSLHSANNERQKNMYLDKAIWSNKEAIIHCWSGWMNEWKIAFISWLLSLSLSFSFRPHLSFTHTHFFLLFNFFPILDLARTRASSLYYFRYRRYQSDWKCKSNSGCLSFLFSYGMVFACVPRAQHVHATIYEFKLSNKHIMFMLFIKRVRFILA